MFDYTFLAIRSPRPEDARPGGGAYYPIPGSVPGVIRAERRDGDSVVEYDVHGLALRYTSGKRDLMRSPDLTGTLFVTDSRVAFASADHETATWIRGQPSRVSGLTVVEDEPEGDPSSAVVGHIRYSWLHGVYAQAAGSATPALLRMFLESQGRMLRVDVGLAGTVDVEAVALDIARRAARHRLLHDRSIGDGERGELSEIARMCSLFQPRSLKQLPGIGFPTYHPVRPPTANLLSVAA